MPGALWTLTLCFPAGLLGLPVPARKSVFTAPAPENGSGSLRLLGFSCIGSQRACQMRAQICGLPTMLRHKQSFLSSETATSNKLSAKVDGRLSRLNPRLFKKLGFERSMASCGSVTGELRRIYQMYGEQSDDSEAADDEEVSETVLLKLVPSSRRRRSGPLTTFAHGSRHGFRHLAKAFRHARIDGLSLLRMLKYDIECLGVRPKLAPCLCWRS